MKKKMRAYDQLLLEEQQLKEDLKFRRKRIIDKWLHLKASVQPAVIGMKLAENTLTHAEIKPVLNTAVNWTINFLVKKWILKKSGWMTKMLIPFILKNITSHVIQKKMLRWKK